jgi:ATP-dependent RNA helicase RhlE
MNLGTTPPLYPSAPEEYVHRIGRTGRAGDTGDALVLVSPEENSLLARIERQLGHSLPRRRLPDFDYAAPPAVPPRHQRRPAPASPKGKRQSSRGRVRRR